MTNPKGGIRDKVEKHFTQFSFPRGGNRRCSALQWDFRISPYFAKSTPDYGCYPYDMEKKLYEIIAELLREQNLISDSEFKRIGRLIQSEYGGKITCERKDG